MANAPSKEHYQPVNLKSASGTSADANIEVVAAVTNKKIKVVGLCLTTIATTEAMVRFEDGSGGTELYRFDLRAVTGGMSGVVLPIAFPGHWFSTSASTALNLENAATQTIHYSVTYYEDDN